VFGLKPQRGRVSLMPDAQHWHGLSVVGCVSRTVADTALWLDVVSGPAPGDVDAARPPETSFADAARKPPRKLRIAVSTKPSQPARVQSEVKKAVEETADLLRSLGHEVERYDPSYGFSLPLFFPRWARGVRDDAQRLPHPERLELKIRRIAALGGLFSPGLVARVRAREAAYAKQVGRVWEDHDVLLCPTIPELPWRSLRAEGHGWFYATNVAAGLVVYTTVWNLTGQPAASVPAGFSPEGLPRAVQLVGRPHDEATLLSLAAQIESERPWADARPPLAA
jgi:amidase